MMKSPEETSKSYAVRLNVLLVDDDRLVHGLIGKLLHDTEFALRSAFSAEEAMKIIRDNWPDIVITDAMMPGESGFSLIQRIKSSPRSAKLPVVLLTILTQADGSVMDASGQADFQIGKPCTRAEIMESLRRAKLLIEKHPRPDEEVTVCIEPPAREQIDIIL